MHFLLLIVVITYYLSLFSQSIVHFYYLFLYINYAKTNRTQYQQICMPQSHDFALAFMIYA